VAGPPIQSLDNTRSHFYSPLAPTANSDTVPPTATSQQDIRGDNSVAAVTSSTSVGEAERDAGTPVRQPRLKPKKGAVSAGPRVSWAGLSGAVTRTPPAVAPAQSSAAPGMKRSISTAALTGRVLEPDVLSALESGLVKDSDVNVYGMRTPWHGMLISLCAKFLATLVCRGESTVMHAM
jgi:hypothetical protein